MLLPTCRCSCPDVSNCVSLGEGVRGVTYHCCVLRDPTAPGHRRCHADGGAIATLGADVHGAMELAHKRRAHDGLMDEFLLRPWGKASGLHGERAGRGGEGGRVGRRGDCGGDALTPRASSPRACNIAITADVPEPHGERSIMPVQVAGRSQSSVPLDMTTALRARRRPSTPRSSGPRKHRMSGPG